MSWQAWAPLTPPAALMSETARPTPAISGGPRKARLPVSGRMPPTLNESALVAPAAHLSLVNAGLRPSDSEVSSDGAAALELARRRWRRPSESPSSPQATRDSPRAAPMAAVAVSRLNRLEAVVDRFTL